jgi:hypothetical protein
MLSIEIIYRKNVPDIQKPLFCVCEYWFARGLLACANIIDEIKLTEIESKPAEQLYPYIGFADVRHDNFKELMNSLKILKSQACQLNVQLFENSKYQIFFVELNQSHDKYWQAAIAIFLAALVCAAVTTNLLLIALFSLALILSGAGFYCTHEPSVGMSLI